LRPAGSSLRISASLAGAVWPEEAMGAAACRKEEASLRRSRANEVSGLYTAATSVLAFLRAAAVRTWSRYDTVRCATTVDPATWPTLIDDEFNRIVKTPSSRAMRSAPLASDIQVTEPGGPMRKAACAERRSAEFKVPRALAGSLYQKGASQSAHFVAVGATLCGPHGVGHHSS
jgi:hypothetical protein